MIYEVTAYFSEIYEVEAETETEAIEKATQQINNTSVIPIPDNFEVQCLKE